MWELQGAPKHKGALLARFGRPRSKRQAKTPESADPIRYCKLVVLTKQGSPNRESQAVLFKGQMFMAGGDTSGLLLSFASRRARSECLVFSAGQSARTLHLVRSISVFGTDEHLDLPQRQCAHRAVSE